MKILVVDDAKTMRYVLIKILHELGYKEIVEADNCQNAIAMAKKEKPDFVFSDWNMPDGTGLDLLKHVRGDAHLKDVPFIIVTTEKDQKKILEASKAGVQAFLLKPMEKKIVSEKLTSLASAYNFPPPRKAPPKTVFVAPSDEATKPRPPHPLERVLKGRLKESDIEKISKLALRGIDEECGRWIAHDVLEKGFNEVKDDVTIMLKGIEDVASNAITMYLKKFL